MPIDPSPACVRNTQALHEVPARVGSFRKLPHDIGMFDVVLLSHVLEHIADLQTTVHDLVRLLNEDGILYIEVPDASRYDEFLFASFQDFNAEHINRFNLTSLQNLFQPHGFEFVCGGQKEIESSPGCPYPAAYAFFRRGEKESTRGSFTVDKAFRERLLNYVTASSARLHANRRPVGAFS